MKEIRAVCDTNVLISALIVKDGNPRKIFEKFLDGKVIFIESEELLAELRDVLMREKFNFIDIDEKEELIKDLIALCEIVQPKQKFHIIERDAKDNKFIEAAVQGKVDYIISGDEHLLNLKKFKNIEIVSPKIFLDILHENKKDMNK